MTPPPCPITGAAGSVLLETISPKLLCDLWRYGAGVAPEPLRRDSAPIGLWRSAAGLYFFHPASEGTPGFYAGFYRRADGYGVLGDRAAERADFVAASSHVRSCDRVLDVGCGDARFARMIPAARYTGLDPHAPPGGTADIRRETLAAHAAANPAAYDVVCGFQVIEHVEAPLALAADMVRCLAPGGLLLLAMPFHGSAMNRIPNNIVNLPPHHLAWWSEPAALALAERLGLEPVWLGLLPPTGPAGMVNWIARLVPQRYRPGRFVRPGFGCMLSVVLAYRLGRWLGRWLPPPRGAIPVDMMLVARKPAPPG